MARQNIVFLMGFLTSQPHIVKKEPDEEASIALANISVVRGPRSVGDKRSGRADAPWILTREPAIVKKIAEWEVGDIVQVKGVLATKLQKKTSTCPECGQKNKIDGTLTYIEPIHVMKITHFDSEDECAAFLVENKEISNQVFAFGSLTRDPKKISPKAGLIVTQYQFAMNRKFRIRTDDPKRKADYPWAKSYGKNAVEDRVRLHIGSEVYIDGCLQARNVQRVSTCEHCGKKYKWKDKAMEVVPFETEYIANCYTQEEAEAIEKERAEQAKRDVLGHIKKEDDSDPITEEDIEAGFDVGGK